MLAGAAYPFPVIYTGGVCPLLWRPVSGIHSFNIPPYVFDLTPFAGCASPHLPPFTHPVQTHAAPKSDPARWPPRSLSTR